LANIFFLTRFRRLRGIRCFSGKKSYAGAELFQAGVFRFGLRQKGSSGSASFHSARKSWDAVRLCRLWYGAAESKSTRGKAAAQQERGRFDFISSATLCREEPAVREFDIGVAPRTEGAPSMAGAHHTCWLDGPWRARRGGPVTAGVTAKSRFKGRVKVKSKRKFLK
jgi:hypothetical protein